MSTVCCYIVLLHRLYFIPPSNATSNPWNVPLQMYRGRGVGAEQLGDVLALAGDSSDNIPGVRYY
jgi:5'-3' exonuclease